MHNKHKKKITIIVNVKNDLVNRNVFFAAFFDLCLVNKFLRFRKLFIYFLNSQSYLCVFAHVSLSYNYVLYTILKIKDVLYKKKRKQSRFY